MKKLLLVSANRYAIPYPVYPLGISYIASYLQERIENLEIRIFDMNLHTDEELIACLGEFRPDYTGISIRNVDDVSSISRECFIAGYKTIVDLIKQNSDTTVIIGGSAFSIFPEDLFRYFEPGFGIAGEGEESFCTLIRSLEKDGPDLRIDGLVYQENGVVKINRRNDYLKSPDLSFSQELIDFYWSKSGMINMQTKRGCPYNCIYCTYPLIEGSKVRTLSLDKIIEGLKDLYFRKNVSYVFFTDSVFNISNDFNISLAERMIREGINIHWGAYFSPHNITRAELRLYKESGLTHIEFGTESLSDSTLEYYCKHFAVSEVIQVSEMCNEIGIYFCHFLILGGYGETEESIAEGFENSKKIQNSVFFPYVGMRIYPGTTLHKLAMEDAVISPEDSLLEPAYYFAKGIDYSTLKERAGKTGRRWVFPDEDVVTFMNRMRERNRKGSLWHHLKK